MLAVVMSLVLVTVLAACGKHNSQSSGNGKYASSQVLNLSYPSSLDSIDISNICLLYTSDAADEP